MTGALSPSRAADFKQCPLKYRFRAIDGLDEPPSPAAARGTLVHAVLEELFELPAPERTPEAAQALVPGRWAAMVQERPELAEMLAADPERDEESWYAEASRLVGRWFELEDPTRLEPAERELRVEADVDGLLLRGIVDRLDVAPTGEVRVVDYKTGRSPSERFESQALFQMKFYALVLWRTTGRVPDLLQLVYLADRQVVRYQPDEHDLRGLERTVRAIWTAIEQASATGDFRPRPSRLCAWCDFKPLCPAFGGTPPTMPVPEVPAVPTGTPTVGVPDVTVAVDDPPALAGETVRSAG
ncbi:RecB family exonuclease [Janibacter alkaliphilus]|uniref:Putative RecB family exonuclease n=1 Tax=Janibacter alkaliphilus TaxID=1069963 RepID=A0A852X450_9MICO|nr:PD-(D/E)XK nuclease family protein [Janibacter alkaliphilus]NYG38142.1 putative RecB family exonuclease [Janibacter alkaliphilus]